jgi:hypothetical protein
MLAEMAKRPRQKCNSASGLQILADGANEQVGTLPATKSSRLLCCKIVVSRD